MVYDEVILHLTRVSATTILLVGWFLGPVVKMFRKVLQVLHLCFFGMFAYV